MPRLADVRSVALVLVLLIAGAQAQPLKIAVDSSLYATGKGQVKPGEYAIPLLGAQAWFGGDAVTVEMGVQDLREGVISFWILPVSHPVTGRIRITGRKKAPGSQMRWADEVELVWGGDWGKKHQSLRIALNRQGQVLANHLSWHNKSQWLKGVASAEGVVRSGEWTHIAYGVGPDGQRLWVNGKLVDRNPAGTQSVSWPYQLRFGEFAGVFAQVEVRSGEQGVASAKTRPGNPFAGSAAELLTVVRVGDRWKRRLAAARERFGKMPYETARLHVLRRCVPLMIYQSLLPKFKPAPEGVDLYGVTRDEVRWTLAAARKWPERMAAIESGQVKPFTTYTVRNDMRTVSVRDGCFWQDGRPIYFVGLQSSRFDLMEGLGLNFSGHTFGPGWTMPKEGVVKESGKDQASRAARAAKRGMMWDILYSGHNFPGWAKKKWPYLNIGLGFMGNDPMSEHGWAIHEITLRKTLSGLTETTNLLGLDLANEPAFNGKTIDAEANWRQWLKRKHGTIETLNRHWETNFKSWDEIPVPAFVNTKWSSVWGQTFPTDPASLRQYGDWSRFNLERVNDWFAKVHQLAHSYLSHTYTYTKMIQSPASNARMGIDVVANVRTTDVSGSDSWWVFNGLDAGGATAADQMSGTNRKKGAEEAVRWSSLMLYDLLTSARPDAPAANAEFHFFGGSFKPISTDWPNPPPGHWDRPIPANHFYAGIWQQAIHGQAMSNIWTHWPRNNVPERPQALAAISQVAMDMNRLAQQVHALNSAERPVGILWGLTPVFWDTSGTWHPEVAKSWATLWRAVTLNGLRPRYVFERDLAEGKVPEVKVLLVQGYSHIDPLALRTLQAARKAGVEIWTVGKEGNFRFDPYGHPNAENLIPGTDRVVGEDVFEADPFAALHTALGDAGLLPKVQILANGHPVRTVHWRAVPWQGGILINLCNYARHTQQIAVCGTGSASRALDLISGKKVDLASVTLDVEQVRLLYVR